MAATLRGEGKTRKKTSPTRVSDWIKICETSFRGSWIILPRERVRERELSNSLRIPLWRLPTWLRRDVQPSNNDGFNMINDIIFKKINSKHLFKYRDIDFCDRDWIRCRILILTIRDRIVPCWEYTRNRIQIKRGGRKRKMKKLTIVRKLKCDEEEEEVKS